MSRHHAHIDVLMRTTIAIDDDVLTAAKAIARQRNQTVGSPNWRAILRPPVAGTER
jgi:Arc/MetJ family transcription regulator